MTAVPELQLALVELVRNDPCIVQLLTGGFHDGTAPGDVPFPYGILGDWTETNRDGLNYIGRQETFLVHIFSKYRGIKEAGAIASRVTRLLNRPVISCESWNVVEVVFEGTETLVEQYEVRHFAMRFRVTTRLKK